MTSAPRSMLHYVRNLAGSADDDPTTDRQLLERYALSDDETAFAVLVQRHGAMVFGVCRRILGNCHSAEDAFQATFLALVQSAGTNRWRESVAGWLHCVAYRIATKASLQLLASVPAREPRCEESGNPAHDVSWREVCGLLDREIRGLPERYRTPILLCYFEGKTNSEAARELGWSKGTLSGRLARARELLRRRLENRGIDSASTLPALLVPAMTAGVPSNLLASATALAGRGESALSGAVVQLAKYGVERSVVAKVGTALLVSVAIVFGGIGLAGGEPPPRQDPPALPSPVTQTVVAKNTLLAPLPPRKPLRDKLFELGGGNAKAKRAIADGLAYLARTQRPDGRWQMSKAGQGKHEAAATAMALLAFLGMGYTHKDKEAPLPKVVPPQPGAPGVRGVAKPRPPAFAGVIGRGLKYLLHVQKKDGSFPGNLYEHAFATMALARAYAATNDAALKPGMRMAVSYIVEAQHKAGGWRYVPRQPGDTSVTILQLTALHYAQLAGEGIPAKTFQRAHLFLDSCRGRQGGYGYVQPRPTRTMTAAGALGRWYLGWNQYNSTLMQDERALEKFPVDTKDVYGDYIVTEYFHHSGSEASKKWFPSVRDRLIATQEADGSWPSKADKFGKSLGDVYSTSFALLTLETPVRAEWWYTRVPTTKITRKELDQLSKDLTGADSIAMRRAVWRLVLGEVSTKLLKEGLDLSSLGEAERKLLRQRIAELRAEFGNSGK